MSPSLPSLPSLPAAVPAVVRLFATAVCLFSLAHAGPARAAIVAGQFVDDDERAVQSISMGGPFRLQARTTSWAAGGFAPVLSLFDLGSGLLLQSDRGSSHGCGDPGAGGADVTSGFCWDAFFDTTLLGGSYALVLTQDGNSPTGDLSPGQLLDDVFPRTGQPDYTGLDYMGASGLRFINVDLTTRTGAWALDFTVEPLRQQVPVPGTWPLALAALAALGFKRRRVVMAGH